MISLQLLRSSPAVNEETPLSLTGNNSLQRHKQPCHMSVLLYTQMRSYHMGRLEIQDRLPTPSDKQRHPCLDNDKYKGRYFQKKE
jgi:hypothetical protein